MNNQDLLPDGSFSPRVKAGFWSFLLVCGGVFVLCIALFSELERRYRNDYVMGVDAEGLVMQHKYDMLRHADLSNEVVFFGDSLIHRNVIPSYFSNPDEAGCAFSAYNAGVMSLDSLEALLLVDGLQRNPHPLPKVMVFDPSFFVRHITMMRSSRSAWVYRGYGSLNSALYASMYPEMPFRRKVKFLYEYALNTLRVGAVASWLQPPVLPDAMFNMLDVIDEQKGYIALDDPIFNGERPVNAPTRYVDGEQRDNRVMIDRFMNRMAQMGVKMVMLYSPTYKNELQHLRKADAIYMRLNYPYIPVVNMVLNAPPELNSYDYWYDHKHMNQRGAQVYTRALHKMLCDVVGGS